MHISIVVKSFWMRWLSKHSNNEMQYQQTCIYWSHMGDLCWVTQMGLERVLKWYQHIYVALCFVYKVWLALYKLPLFISLDACIILSNTRIILYLHVASQMGPTWIVSLGILCCSDSYILTYAWLFAETGVIMWAIYKGTIIYTAAICSDLFSGPYFCRMCIFNIGTDTKWVHVNHITNHLRCSYAL